MTHRLFDLFTSVGAEWVMTLLLALSVVSVALMLERLVFFLRFGRSQAELLAPLLARGELDAARRALAGRAGLEPAAILAALDAAAGGPLTVEETVASVVAAQRPAYERFLSFLGTLGNNAPFLGLFGTVVGVIKAFADLGAAGAKAGAAVVMAGISEALVATAAGLAVAILALAAYNYLQVRSGAVAAAFARSCERFVQALLYVESASMDAASGSPAEVKHGRPLPA
jgi:biopolymer transport protein ExbB